MIPDSFGYGIAVAISTFFIGLFGKFYMSYKNRSKKLIDLEYKDDKAKIKEEIKDDSIDTVIDRINKRFR